jgi:hypothetical protein
MDQITPEGAPNSEPVDPDSAETYTGPAIPMPRSEWMSRIVVRLPITAIETPEA